jgi:hypothetical protein
MVLLALSLAAGLVQPTPDPQAIFKQTLTRLASYPVAAYALYTTTWNISEFTPHQGRTSYQAHHRYAIRTSDNLENSSSGAPLRAPAPDALPDASVLPAFIGPFAWSLRATASQATPGPMQPDLPSPLRTIASVVAKRGPDYRIDIAGIEDVNGHRSYHLAFHPLFDEVRHNLRDLWVDVTTYDLWRAHYIGAYSLSGTGYFSPSDVTAYFKPVAAYWIVSETAFSYRNRGPDSGGFVFDVLIDDIVFPQALPDWVFDSVQYRQHQKARDPNILWQLLPTPTPLPPTSQQPEPPLG